MRLESDPTLSAKMASSQETRQTVAKETSERAKQQASIMRKTLGHAALITFLAITVATGSGWLLRDFFGKLSVVPYVAGQVIGVGTILTVSMSFLMTSDFPSFGGKTLAEILNQKIFEGGYVIGTFLVVLSLTWGT